MRHEAILRNLDGTAAILKKCVCRSPGYCEPGLTIDALEGEVRFSRPELPALIQELRIHNLSVGQATVDLCVVRQEGGVSVSVMRREGDVRIIVER